MPEEVTAHMNGGPVKGNPQPEAPPETQVEAQVETYQKGRCSCAVVEKYKKPMTIMTIILLFVLNVISVIVGIIQSSSSPCPIEPVIPILLIGAGSVGIVTRILLIVKHYKKVENRVLNCLVYIFLAVELIFLIAGSWWIFGHFMEKQTSCNGAAFTWAFLILIFYYLILLSPLFIPCCIESYRCCFVNPNMRLVA